MVQRHSRLRRMMALPLIFILIAETVIVGVCPVLVVDAVDVDYALVAVARLPSDLDYALVRTSCLNRGLAQTTSAKFLLLPPFTAAMPARILRIIVRGRVVEESRVCSEVRPMVILHRTLTHTGLVMSASIAVFEGALATAAAVRLRDLVDFVCVQVAEIVARQAV